MSSIVEVRDPHYTYEDGTQALRGVDFDLEDGVMIALLGPTAAVHGHSCTISTESCAAWGRW